MDNKTMQTPIQTGHTWLHWSNQFESHSQGQVEECQLAGQQEQRQVVVIVTAVVAVVDMLEVVAAVLWRREALPCRRKQKFEEKLQQKWPCTDWHYAQIC